MGTACWCHKPRAVWFSVGRESRRETLRFWPRPRSCPKRRRCRSTHMLQSEAIWVLAAFVAAEEFAFSTWAASWCGRPQHVPRGRGSRLTTPTSRRTSTSSSYSCLGQEVRAVRLIRYFFDRILAGGAHGVCGEAVRRVLLRMYSFWWRPAELRFVVTGRSRFAACGLQDFSWLQERYSYTVLLVSCVII